VGWGCGFGCGVLSHWGPQRLACPMRGGLGLRVRVRV